LVASAGNVVNPFRYTARELDSETGLYYYRARYYDPSTGRFLSEDPLGLEADDLNLYRYVRNGPTNLKDPDGLAKTFDCGGGCGFRVERDPHKGLHVNWWCNGLQGCLRLPELTPCEVGKSDKPPAKILDCIRQKLRIPAPRTQPFNCPVRIPNLPKLPTVLPTVLMILLIMGAVVLAPVGA